MYKNAVLGLLCVVFSASEASASLLFVDRLQSDHNIAEIETAIQAFRGSEVDVYFYDKLVGGASTQKTASVGGTWDVIDPNATISYMTVKAGNDYALYEVLPNANSGLFPGVQWDYSLWTTQRIAETPEPTTYLLLSGALVGLYFSSKATPFRLKRMRGFRSVSAHRLFSSSVN